MRLYILELPLAYFTAVFFLNYLSLSFAHLHSSDVHVGVGAEEAVAQLLNIVC